MGIYKKFVSKVFPFIAIGGMSLLLCAAIFKDDLFEISKNLDIFSGLYKEVNLNYVDETKPGQLIKTAADAMLSSLDPYTEYYNESEIEDYKIITTGQYGGVGASVRQIKDKLVISEVYENSPAAKAGVKTGDILLEINGLIIKGKNTEEISRLMKGQAGTNVKIKIQKPNLGKLSNLNLQREEIRLKDVPFMGIVSGQIGYIKLTSFSQDAGREVRDALVKLKSDNNCTALILDLRENPGGLLQQAIDIVNLFVEKGLNVCITKGRIKDDVIYKSVNSPIDLNMPLVVLVNRNSASASEVVSGSLQDLDRAVIIGQRTFGKGLVQQTKPISYNTQIKLTVAKYYIPSGRCIQALDYSHRNSDGSVDQVPDSLITAFKTRGGRIVYDGAGILPDILTEQQIVSELAFSLISNDFIFNYATDYVVNHPDLMSDPVTFKLTASEYADFVKNYPGKDYHYNTECDDFLEDFKKSSEEAHRFDSLKGQVVALQKKLEYLKQQEFEINKEEIKSLLEEEIVTRYFYNRGKIERMLKTDKDIIRAVSILTEANKVKTVLTTIESPKKKFNPNRTYKN